MKFETSPIVKHIERGLPATFIDTDGDPMTDREVIAFLIAAHVGRTRTQDAMELKLTAWRAVAVAVAVAAAVLSLAISFAWRFL